MRSLRRRFGCATTRDIWPRSARHHLRQAFGADDPRKEGWLVSFARLLRIASWLLETLSGMREAESSVETTVVPKLKFPEPYGPDRAFGVRGGNQARETDQPRTQSGRSRFFSMSECQSAENQIRLWLVNSGGNCDDAGL